jgi:hypothetical protein
MFSLLYVLTGTCMHELHTSVSALLSSGWRTLVLKCNKNNYGCERDTVGALHFQYGVAFS